MHESSGDRETENAVASAADPRVRHLKTVQPVSMTENWERALSCAARDYVTFIGDDDGVLSDACAAAARILDQHTADLLSWRPDCYFWPKYVSAGQRNRFRCPYSHLPMIYNSFVSKDLVQRVRKQMGHYFFGTAPDVVSGIVNAVFSESSLLSERPLSCSGLSHQSTGHRIYFSGDDASGREATLQMLSPGSGGAPPRNLALFIEAEMETAKRFLFPNEAPGLDHNSLVWSALQLLDAQSAQYPAMMAEIEQNLMA